MKPDHKPCLTVAGTSSTLQVLTKLSFKHAGVVNDERIGKPLYAHADKENKAFS